MRYVVERKTLPVSRYKTLDVTKVIYFCRKAGREDYAVLAIYPNIPSTQLGRAIALGSCGSIYDLAEYFFNPAVFDQRSGTRMASP